MNVTEKLESIHASSEIKFVRISKLQADTTYQRVPSLKLIGEITSNWNLVASELILVADRGPRPEDSDIKGGLFIVNGQHRTAAADRLGITEMEARVINLRKEENPVAIEAAFRLQTGVRLGDKAFERFKAQLAAGDKESLHIVKVLSAAGTQLSFHPSEEGILAVAAVEKIYRQDDTGALLRETLDMLYEVYGTFTGKSSSSSTMKGMAWFIVVHSSTVDRTRAIIKFRELSSAAMDAKARQFAGTMGGALWINLYKALVDSYNDGLSEKHKLDWNVKGATKMGTRRQAFADHV